MDQAPHQSKVGAGSVADVSTASPEVPALTRGLVRGEEEAYRKFYDAYFNRLFGYLLVVTRGDEHAARDALQATLVRVVRHIKVFPDETQFWNWLTTLARSALADEGRKRRRYFSFLDRFARHTETEFSGRNDNHTDERLRSLLERGVASLDEEERRLVEHKYFARRSVRELADEFQTTEKAIESKLSRIRRKLKETVLTGLNDEPKTENSETDEHRWTQRG